ncbi:MAG TPA: hypothetical protein VIM58_08495, partial [Candidatus Methylacidiphilales bacterium]
QMDRVTQSTAAGAEETASAAEELDSQSGELRSSVLSLVELLEGRKDGAAASPGLPTPSAPARSTRPRPALSTRPALGARSAR